MKRTMNPWDHFSKVQEQLQGNGAFLVSVDATGRPNVMTIGWGLIGTAWRRPIFLVLVRPSRYTHGCIKTSRVFSVNVPFGTLSEELAFCGAHSGRDIDKVKELGLELEPGRAGPVPIISAAHVNYECRVVASSAITQELISDEIRARHYGEDDFHTLFFGEILSSSCDSSL